ncbi:MAG: hypothetical protein H6726_29915 [Sandaracinaceae bacterium]|nr:hypothetical protein [Sandaracinaceae bacterium]
MSLEHRQELWDSLGPRNDAAKNGEVTPAHRGRTHLMRLCVERVIPIWEQAEDRGAELLAPADRPQAMLEEAARRLSGEDSWEHTSTSIRRFSSLVNYLYELDEIDTRLHFIVRAAMSAVSIALRDIADYPHGWSELANESFVADALASWAWCGATPWARGLSEDSERRRREFWQWYVDEAFPLAWNEARG